MWTKIRVKGADDRIYDFRDVEFPNVIPNGTAINVDGTFAGEVYSVILSLSSKGADPIQIVYVRIN